MLVGERMSHPVITVHPDTPIQDALNLMRQERIRRAPVVDKRGRMVGIVSEKDLLNASPSQATSLSVWELHYLISKVTVKEIMSREVITVTEDTPIEEAARVMIDNETSGLPVMREGKAIGMITETDLFKIFLELFGARERGVRIAALMPDVPGELAKLTFAVHSLGGNIVALGTFLGESTEDRLITLKVSGIDIRSLEEAIGSLVERVVDVRET